MADKNLWTTFEKTGSIVDYLNYRGIRIPTDEQQTGESAVESVDYGNRVDTVCDTHR